MKKLQTKQEIELWLNQYDIKNYHIRDNLVVDVYQNVYLSISKLNFIPVQFGIIWGNFYCHGNNLISLEGSPQIVLREFNCSYNQLTSLEGGPQIVDGYFDCNSNKLINLKYCPQIIEGNFYFNKKLNLIDYKPIYIGCGGL